MNNETLNNKPVTGPLTRHVPLTECHSQRDIPRQPERLAFKLPEVSRMLGISNSSTRRLIARGQLRPLRNLRHVLVSRSELERFVSTN